MNQKALKHNTTLGAYAFAAALIGLALAASNCTSQPKPALIEPPEPSTLDLPPVPWVEQPAIQTASPQPTHTEFILISAGAPIKIDGKSVTKLPYEFTGTNIPHTLRGKLWGSSNFTYNGSTLKGF